MAIYSCSHNPVGRTTHRAGTAGAHARYVTRDNAASQVLGQHMPTGREASKAWLIEQELADRKNARVIDKLMLALPIELDAAQRAELVRDFAGSITQGRIPWLAAIHDRGEDAHNPHCHLIVRDRDITTGKRVYGMSEKGSTERLRQLWQDVANRHLERAGHDARIDHRSLEAQGKEQTPGLHVGPKVAAMEARGIEPQSRIRLDGERVIDWPRIDGGRSRAVRNAEIRASNDNARMPEATGPGAVLVQEVVPQAARAPEIDRAREVAPPEPQPIPAPAPEAQRGDSTRRERPPPAARQIPRREPARDLGRAVGKVAEAGANRAAGGFIGLVIGLLGKAGKVADRAASPAPAKEDEQERRRRQMPAPRPAPAKAPPPPKPTPAPPRRSVADELADRAKGRADEPAPPREPLRERERERDRSAFTARPGPRFLGVAAPAHWRAGWHVMDEFCRVLGLTITGRPRRHALA